MNTGAFPRLWTIFLVTAGCGGDQLPPLIANSKYIDYHTDVDVDASAVCMDDMLSREDRYIERTAKLLGVDPPSRTIHFVWDPVQDGSEPWGCDGSAETCYMYRGGSDLDVVVSDDLSHHHELVHAVEFQALGEGNLVLVEGIAEYLGSLNQNTFADGTFPELFKAMVAAGPETTMDYGLARHFVGSLVARHGVAKYRALRAKMPKDAGLERFAEVFEAEFNQSLDKALIEMSEQVRGNDVFAGCEEGGAPELAWTGEGLLETTVDSSCGDSWFYGAGFVEGLAGFFGRYVIEVPEAGYYNLTIGGSGGPAPLRGAILACSFSGDGIASRGGRTENGLLHAGKYSLVIAFPPRTEPIGGATVQLEYSGPPP